MSTFGKTIILIILAIVVLAATYFGLLINYQSSEVRLRATITQKQKTNEASRDTMFNILKNKAGVLEQHREDFKAIWVDLVGKRYENDKGVLFKWVQEKNPEWDTSLYKDLMVSIEAERHRFLRDQVELASLKVSHDTLLNSPVSGFFLSGRAPIEITIVTSSGSQEAFRTGTDDEDPLAKPKKK